LVTVGTAGTHISAAQSRIDTTQRQSERSNPELSSVMLDNNNQQNGQGNNNQQQSEKINKVQRAKDQVES
jgi:hypothetical protein